MEGILCCFVMLRLLFYSEQGRGQSFEMSGDLFFFFFEMAAWGLKREHSLVIPGSNLESSEWRSQSFSDTDMHFLFSLAKYSFSDLEGRHST